MGGLRLFDWPSVGPNLDTMVATMQAFMVHAAKALHCAKPEARHVAVMILDVVHHFGDGDAAFALAEFAQARS